MTKQRMIIVSFDAMGARDLSYMQTLPNFRRFLEHAAVCRNVSSVYPSVTYPAHTSIVTGKKPCHHGIIDNTLLQPGREKPDWYWQRKYVKGTTLYDEAIRAGFKTAGLLWPVTASSRIHYNIPEVLANRPWENQVIVSAWNSTLWYVIKMNRLFGKLRDGVRQPALDHFTHACALYTLEHYRPDLFLIHYTDLDTNRHLYGLDHEKAFEAMRRHDIRLGELLTMLEKTGDMKNTTVAILGDHCQMDTKTIVYPNHRLMERGYLQVRNGRIQHYRVIAKNCDGSCYLYLHPSQKKNTALKEEMYRLAEQWQREEAFGIQQVFTGKEAEKMGADGSCLLMLEAKKGFYFLDEAEVFTREVEDAGKGKMRAVHGYLPDREDYQTFFAASGYGIRENAQIASMELYDEGPTLAKIMGLTLPEADGRVIEELLSELK